MVAGLQLLSDLLIVAAAVPVLLCFWCCHEVLKEPCFLTWRLEVAATTLPFVHFAAAKGLELRPYSWTAKREGVLPLTINRKVQNSLVPGVPLPLISLLAGNHSRQIVFNSLSFSAYHSSCPNPLLPSCVTVLPPLPSGSIQGLSVLSGYLKFDAQICSSQGMFRFSGSFC